MRSKRELIRNTLILALLWCLVMTGVGMGRVLNADSNMTVVGAVQSDEAEDTLDESDGPIILAGGIGSNMYVDLLEVAAPISFTLELGIRIWDPNGVETAIASYKGTVWHKNSTETNSMKTVWTTETAWTNITMDYQGVLTNVSFSYQGHFYTNMTVHVFGCNATTFTLTPENSSVIWSMKHYVRNVLGRWSVSEMYNYSFIELGSLPYTDSSQITQVVTAALTVGGIVMVVTVLYLRRPH